MRRLGIPLVHPHPQDTPHLRHLQGTVSIDCYLLQAYGTVDAMCTLDQTLWKSNGAGVYLREEVIHRVLRVSQGWVAKKSG
jgi:hypothetical protein